MIWCPIRAIVGAHNTSSLGNYMARYLMRGLVRLGLAVINRLVHGLEIATHFRLIKHITIAVTAIGVNIFYPVDKANLGHDLTKTGLGLSNLPIDLTYA